MTDFAIAMPSSIWPVARATLAASVSGGHAAHAAGGQPNWIVALLLGAAAATMMDKYGGVLLYPVRLLRSDQYLGEWWEYHLSYLHDQRTVRRAKLTISRGLQTRVRRAKFWHITTDDSGRERRELRYKGTLRVENGQLLIELRAKTHTEHLVYRFLNRIPSNDAVIPGIWMSFDHDSRPAAGAAVLCKQKLTVEKAEQEMQRHATAGVIRIK